MSIMTTINQINGGSNLQTRRLKVCQSITMKQPFYWSLGGRWWYPRSWTTVPKIYHSWELSPKLLPKWCQVKNHESKPYLNPKKCVYTKNKSLEICSIQKIDSALSRNSKQTNHTHRSVGSAPHLSPRPWSSSSGPSPHWPPPVSAHCWGRRPIPWASENGGRRSPHGLTGVLRKRNYFYIMLELTPVPIESLHQKYLQHRIALTCPVFFRNLISLPVDPRYLYWIKTPVPSLSVSS